MKKINIYVATHKKYNPINDKTYVPLQVGAALKDDLGYEKDSYGDNISKKNKSFCELTGLYWMWKNSKTEIIGLVHYRRYFYKNMWNNKESNILTAKDIKDTLKEYDCIVTKKAKILLSSVEKHYALTHHKEDFEAVRIVINKKYKEYATTFERVSKSNYFYNLNMMICNKKIFDDYCEWLFGLLFEVEKITDVSNYSDYDKRLYGFLSERLLRVWLEHNNYKLKECYVYNNEIGFGKQLLKRIVMNCIPNKK